MQLQNDLKNSCYLILHITISVLTVGPLDPGLLKKSKVCIIVTENHQYVIATQAGIQGFQALTGYLLSQVLHYGITMLAKSGLFNRPCAFGTHGVYYSCFPSGPACEGIGPADPITLNFPLARRRPRVYIPFL